ncbi:MAG TPA: phasin family protein [Microvirga sp.]|nr:phasin family protein [Microvirga sp.]
MATQSAAAQERVTSLRAEFPSRELVAGAETWWSTMAECQREIGQFISDRLAKDGETIRQALSCRDWKEALDIQAKWLDQTVRDYNAEITKLTGLYTRAASAAVRDERRA